MNRLPRVARLGVLAAVLAGCAVPVQTTRLVGGPEPVTVRLEPAVPSAGQSAELTITSPGADSIIFKSANGLDRYSGTRGVLRAQLTSDFGDSVPTGRYAVRWRGQLLSRLEKPAFITVCREGRCRELYHEIPVQLPEANRRTVALTAGYSTVFARRSLVGSHSTRAVPRGAEQRHLVRAGGVADRAWNARAEAYAGRGERGGGVRPFARGEARRAT